MMRISNPNAVSIRAFRRIVAIALRSDRRGVRPIRLTAATITIARNIATLITSSRPYSVCDKQLGATDKVRRVDDACNGDRQDSRNANIGKSLRYVSNGADRLWRFVRAKA